VFRRRSTRLPAEAAEAADPEDAALREADRAQGRLGRAQTTCRHRVPREVGRRQGPASVLQGAAGRFIKIVKRRVRVTTSASTLVADIAPAAVDDR
jgi:hypothetical protein